MFLVLSYNLLTWYQNTMENSISSGQSLFNSAIDQTKAAVGSKPVWVTETGWPLSGPTQNQAEASVDNAKTYWDEVGCDLFGSTNVWWYTLQDAAPDTPSPSFGIVGSTLTSQPLYDLSCNASSSSAPSPSVSGTAAATASGAASATGLGSGSPGISGGVGSGSPTATGAGSSPSGSSSTGGSGSGSGSSSGGAGSNGTFTGSSSAPSSTTSMVTTSSASSNIVSFAAAFIAMLGASLVL